MPYTAEISRDHPTSLVFMVDRSYSMDDPVGGQGKRKADAVADAINRLLSELSIRCAKEEEVLDYFHVGVLGYGSAVGSAFGGPLAGRGLVPISEIADAPLRVEDRSKQSDDGAGGVTTTAVKFPVWFDAEAAGGTPMGAALLEVEGTITKWVADHPDDYPPIVLNISDGEATDGDPTARATQLKQLGTADGKALVFNLHISSASAQPIYFPDSDGALPDQFARQLFEMSSVLPNNMRQVAASLGYSVTDASRGFVFNADIAAMVQFLDIGTRVDTQLR